MYNTFIRILQGAKISVTWRVFPQSLVAQYCFYFKREAKPVVGRHTV